MISPERLSEIEASPRDAMITRAEAKELCDAYRTQGLSQQDRDACNAGSMAAIQLSKIQPSKLQSEGWVEVAAILRRLGGQTT